MESSANLRGQVRASLLGSYNRLMDSVVSQDPEVMGGTAVFAGTRVPVQTLLDYIEGNQTLVEFLDDFPTVGRDQAVAFLESARDALLRHVA